MSEQIVEIVRHSARHDAEQIQLAGHEHLIFETNLVEHDAEVFDERCEKRDVVPQCELSKKVVHACRVAPARWEWERVGQNKHPHESGSGPRAGVTSVRTGRACAQLPRPAPASA